MKEKVFLSAAEKRELILKRIYLLLPLLSIGMLLFLWIISSREGFFPSPQAVWDRFLLIMERPIRGYTIIGHTLHSLRRIFLTLLIA